MFQAAEGVEAHDPMAEGVRFDRLMLVRADERDIRAAFRPLVFSFCPVTRKSTLCPRSDRMRNLGDDGFGCDSMMTRRMKVGQKKEKGCILLLNLA
jgi:hypothetical protein